MLAGLWFKSTKNYLFGILGFDFSIKKERDLQRNGPRREEEGKGRVKVDGGGRVRTRIPLMMMRMGSTIAGSKLTALVPVNTERGRG